MENKNTEMLIADFDEPGCVAQKIINHSTHYNKGENVINYQSADNSDTHTNMCYSTDVDCGKSATDETENTGFGDGTGIQERPSGNKPLWKLADDSRINSIESIRKDYEDIIRKVEDMISAAEERGMFRISLTTKDGIPVRLLGNTLKDYFTCMGYKCKFLMYDDVLNNSELFISWLN